MHVLAMLIVAMLVQHAPAQSKFCPAKASGYVRISKDGYVIGGGSGAYDARQGVLTAWFPPLWSKAGLFLRLRLHPVNVQTEGTGWVKAHHGVFCVFGVKPATLRVSYAATRSLTRSRAALLHLSQMVE